MRSRPRPPHRAPLLVAVVAPVLAAGLTLGAAGCGSESGSTESAPTMTSARSTASAPSTTAALTAVEGLRTKRYCEVLLVQVVDGDATAEVFNTYPLNDCPPQQWEALDAPQLAQEHDATLAVLNGPRYWLMDRIDKQGERQALETETFGDLEMYRQASVAVGPLAAASKPYSPNEVDRRTVFTFDEGRTVYELTDPDGRAYVMQSWSQQKDPSLVEAGLADLGSRLELPPGWGFRTRVLAEPLRIVTVDHPATVVQDDLGNSYSQEPEA